MTEKIEIRLPKAKNTTSTGASLAASLYTVPLTLFLKGELGAGKTTFLQGFAQGLGIKERLTSPTYALEQRYRIPSPRGGLGLRRGEMELLHIDLYRITPNEAKELVESSDDFQGIRCIEWSEKISEQQKIGPHMDLLFEDTEKSGRNLYMQFHDISLPSQKQILTWRKDVALPRATCHHCDIVGIFAEKVAHSILKNGTIVRPLALRRAGELHDLFRFLDFKDPPPPSPRWKKWKKRFPHVRHEAACVSFLCEHGFDALAAIIETHGLMLPSPERRTIEQKILFYADKRVVDHVVSIDERFEYFKQRYGNGTVSKKHTQWYEEVKAIEKELFPDGVPF